MRKIQRTITTVAASVGLIFSGAAAANAITENPIEGGTWNYGLALGLHVYSDYIVG